MLSVWHSPLFVAFVLQIRENLKHITLFDDENGEDNKIYQRNLDEEIMKWRERLRTEIYLFQQDHVTLSRNKLDEDLVNFDKTCEKNRNLYQSDIKAGKEPGKGTKLTPIFTTPFSRSNYRNITNKTKVEIASIISNGIKEICTLGRTDEALNLLSLWSKIQNKATKDENLSFKKDVTIAFRLRAKKGPAPPP